MLKKIPHNRDAPPSPGYRRVSLTQLTAGDAGYAGLQQDVVSRA